MFTTAEETRFIDQLEELLFGYVERRGGATKQERRHLLAERLACFTAYFSSPDPSRWDGDAEDVADRLEEMAAEFRRKSRSRVARTRQPALA
jgi:hypothetical protein